ncbi:MAG: ComEC/Rec2 family competence protein [Clostridia bacterium]|nr:ComEC/Rec2 family competence protein [Clostridia bacterium]
MGRPFAIIGLSMFASLFFIGTLGILFAYILFGIAACVLAVMLCIKKLRAYKAVLLAAAAVMVACVLHSGAYYLSYKPCLQYMDKTVSVRAKVKDFPEYQYDTYYVEAEVEEIGGKRVKSFGVRISFAELEDVAPGDSLSFRATLHSAGAGSKFSQLNYLSKGIYATAFCSEEPQHIPNTAAFKGFSYYLACYRRGLIQSLMGLMPKENAALAAAVLIGEKSYIPAESLEDINTVGISHIICVSGLHLSIIGFALLQLMSKLRFNRKAKYLIAAAFIVFFMALCGFTNSVVRAGIMFLVYIAAELLLAEPDSLNALGLAGLVILLNPFSAGNIGFIFSFCATLAIITVGSKVIEHYKEKWEIGDRNKAISLLFSLFEILVISLAVNAFCLPFGILIFQKISLIGIVANVFILPFATVLVISCGIAAFLGLLPLAFSGILAYPAAFVSSALCRYILSLCHWMAQLPFSSMYAGSFMYLLLVAIALVAVALLLLLRAGKRTCRIVAAVLAVSFCGGIALQFFSNARQVELTVHALGNSSCITVKCGDEFLLIDAGKQTFTFQKVKESLFASDSNDIDYFFISSANSEQSAKALKILHSMRVKDCYMPQGEQYEAFRHANSTTRFHNERFVQMTTKRGINVRFYALKFSAVQIEYAGKKVLFLGSSKAEIEALPEPMRSYDYLIVHRKLKYPFSKGKTNAIIEITKAPEPEREKAMRALCAAYYTTDTLQDIHLILTPHTSTIGRSNEWQQ